MNKFKFKLSRYYKKLNQNYLKLFARVPHHKDVFNLGRMSQFEKCLQDNIHVNQLNEGKNPFKRQIERTPNLMWLKNIPKRSGQLKG